jgi:hypothetical protein
MTSRGDQKPAESAQEFRQVGASPSDGAGALNRIFSLARSIGLDKTAIAPEWLSSSAPATPETRMTFAAGYLDKMFRQAVAPLSRGI